MNKSGIIVLGNYSPSGHDASRIVDENGVAPTVKECDEMNNFEHPIWK